MGKRISGLDSVRGLAAVLVVFYHYLTRYHEVFGEGSQLPFFDFTIGKYGVQTFFILSGMVILLSAKNSSGQQFFLKRIIRIYPLYMLAVVITFVIVNVFGLPGREQGLQTMLINLTMLQGVLKNVPHIDGVYWTLVVEMKFYIVIAVYILIDKKKRAHLLSLLWLAAGTITYNFNFGFLEKYMNFAGDMIIAEYCHLFVIGMMILQVWRNDEGHKSWFIIGLSIVYSYINLGLQDTSVTVAVTLIVLFITFKEVKILENKVLIYFGELSYGLYLIHQNIGYIIIRAIDKHILEIGYLYVLIPFGLMVLLAHVMTYYYDVPVRKVIKKSILS